MMEKLSTFLAKEQRGSQEEGGSGVCLVERIETEEMQKTLEQPRLKRPQRKLEFLSTR
jgi:hypothetical protein